MKLALVAHAGAGGLAVELGVLVLLGILVFAAWRAGRRADAHDDDGSAPEP